ncbi:MAG TPA: ABC transporter permease subunit [Anaerolineales bacterium]|jgi:ABC-2 type transport system permease protein|nr:ABC transporter permease subunit [Anaerolineales bacterium]
MDKINTIIRKEWAEVFKNRFVLFTVAFLPLIFTVLPLGILYSTRSAASSNLTADMPAQFASLCPAGISGGECFQIFMVSQFMILFMLLPVTIPVTIAAYSIVGEKATRSLEPLLATPISTAELLTGKSLAAAIPAILATWAGFIIYAIGARILVSNPRVYLALIDPMWLIAVILVGPLLAIMAVNASIMVSSRVNDPRVAEQLSMVVIVPVLALFFGQIAGLFFLNRQLIVIIAAILILIDVGLVYLSVQLFQRETILTRWK